MMQLIADTSGRRCTCPPGEEIPARGAALFGAVAAGVYDGIDAAIDATRPAASHTYTPDPEARRSTTGSTRIYRELYESLGARDVSLLHGLKRIRAESGGPLTPELRCSRSCATRCWRPTWRCPAHGLVKLTWGNVSGRRPRPRADGDQAQRRRLRRG